jgi:hypothetical protein
MTAPLGRRKRFPQAALTIVPEEHKKPFGLAGMSAPISDPSKTIFAKRPSKIRKFTASIANKSFHDVLAISTGSVTLW